MRQRDLMRDAVMQLGGLVSADEAAALFECVRAVPDTLAVVVGGTLYSEPECRLVVWCEEIAPAWFKTLPELVQAYGWACANPHADPPQTRNEAFSGVSKFMHKNRLSVSELVLVIASATGIVLPYPETEQDIIESVAPYTSPHARQTLTELRREAKVASPHAARLAELINKIEKSRGKK